MVQATIGFQDENGNWVPVSTLSGLPTTGGGGGGITNLQPGENITIDDSDPNNVIISSAGTSAYQEWIAQGNSGTELDFLDALRGPTGATGSQGIQGEPGPQGPAGADGLQGADGQPGSTGAQGVEGPQGPRGDDGTSIVIDGYAQAVADLPDLTGDPAGPSYIVMETGHIHFWNGTDWTDGGNVTGPPGQDGTAGAQGPQGAQGDPGIQGIQGEDGEPGAGIATGGAVGEVVVKTGTNDYETGWAASGRLPIILTQAAYDALDPKVPGQIYVTYSA